MYITLLATFITDLNNKVIDLLQVNGIFNDIMRGLGFWIYTAFGSIVDTLDSIFHELVKVDLSSVIDIGGLKTTLNDVTWYLLLITLLGVVIMHFFSNGKDFTFLRNLFLIIIAITIFTEFTGYMNDVKNAGMETIDKSLGRSSDTTMSEKVFKDNSYDMLNSVKKNNLIKISDKVKPQRISINEQISKNDLQGKFDYDENGNVSVKNLSDGIFGIGDERYYRYSTNFLSINFTLLVMMIFYLIGGFKMIYIMWDLFFVNVLGTITMVTGVNNFRKISSVFGYVVKTTVTFLITYGSMMMFSNVVVSVFRLKINWLAQLTILVGFGFTVILGSGFVSKLLNLDDGSGFLMKSLFTGRALSRAAKNFVKSGANLAKGATSLATNAGSNLYDKGSSMANTAIQKSNDRKFREGMNDYINNQQSQFQKSKLNDSIYGKEKQLENNEIRTPKENEQMIADEKGFIRRENIYKNTDSQTDNQKDDMKSDVASKTLKNVPNQNDIYKTGKDVIKPTNLEKSAWNQKNDISKKPQESKKLPSGIPADVKSYEQYKKDYFEKGDKSIYKNSSSDIYGKEKKSYSKDYAMKKELPSWYMNQDEVHTDIDDFNEEELMKDLQDLKNQSNKKE